MNIFVFQLIMLALAAAIHWDAPKCQKFCQRIEPLIHTQDISREELDDILLEFDIPTTPSIHVAENPVYELGELSDTTVLPTQSLSTTTTQGLGFVFSISNI